MLKPGDLVQFSAGSYLWHDLQEQLPYEVDHDEVMLVIAVVDIRKDVGKIPMVLVHASRAKRLGWRRREYLKGAG